MSAGHRVSHVCTTYQVHVVQILEPAPVVVAVGTIGTNVPIRAVKVAASRLLGTTPGTSAMFQRELLAGAQPLAVVVVAVLAGLAVPPQVVVVAHLLLLGALKQPRLGAGVGLGQVRVDAFVVLVHEYVLAVRGLLGRNVDLLLSRRGLAYRCPRRRCGLDRGARAGGFGHWRHKGGGGGGGVYGGRLHAR